MDLTGRKSATIISIAIASFIALPVRGEGFVETSSWSAFDPGENGVGSDPDGYSGAVFDGRYLYFAPTTNGPTSGDAHGEVLRFDTTGLFADTGSWATFDAGANGIGSDADGYIGLAFDGRYVYFSPWFNGLEQHGEVLRYDTQGDFSTASSWAAFDAGANGVGSDPDGYQFPVVHGGYIYFAPGYNGNSFHGEVLRFNTAGSFGDPAAWETYDYGEDPNGCALDPNCTTPVGYTGAVVAGQHIYFVPTSIDDSNDHGEVLRYDTTGAFANAGSWEAYDYGADPDGCTQNPLCDDPDGYIGGVSDGRYVYFAPQFNDNQRHGEVLRYDTTGGFTDDSSWATYDYGDDPNGCATQQQRIGVPCTDPDGYAGAVFDGTFVYFVPVHNGTEFHGAVLRHDTTKSFTQSSSWTTFDPGANGIGSTPDGYIGAAFDGQHIYFVPNSANVAGSAHGEVMRYDTLTDIPTVSTWGLLTMSLLLVIAGTLVFRGMTKGRESF